MFECFQSLAHTQDSFSIVDASALSSQESAPLNLLLSSQSSQSSKGTQATQNAASDYEELEFTNSSFDHNNVLNSTLKPSKIC